MSIMTTSCAGAPAHDRPPRRRDPVERGSEEPVPGILARAPGAVEGDPARFVVVLA